MRPQARPVPLLGSPFSMKVSTSIQAPLTATTKSATDRLMRERAQVAMEIHRSQLQPLLSLQATQRVQGSSVNTQITGDFLLKAVTMSYINQWFHLENSYRFLKARSMSL